LPATPPAWLRGVVARALAPSPARRYPTGEALANALDGPRPARTRGHVAILLVMLGSAAAGLTWFETSPTPVQVAPDAVSPLVAAGWERLRARDVAAAAAAFDRAVALDPACARA